MTRASDTAAVAGKLSPIVQSLTLSKIVSDTTPNAPVNSSMAASKGKGGMPRRFDSQPPARLPMPETEHEGGDDDRHRLDIDAEDEKQLPLPCQLIDQRRKTGKEKQNAEHARPLREPLAALGRVQGRGQIEAGHEGWSRFAEPAA